MNYIIQFWSYLAQFFLEWELFRNKICRENQNTHLTINNLSKNRAFLDNVENMTQPDKPWMTL